MTRQDLPSGDLGTNTRCIGGAKVNAIGSTIGRALIDGATGFPLTLS